MPELRSFAAPIIAAACFCATPALAQDEVTLDANGLIVELAGGKIAVELGGKLQVDASVFGLDGETVSEADFRRVRPDLRIRFADVVALRAEWEFSGSRGWRNLYAEMMPVEGLSVRGGNFVPPFSMEDLQSSASIPFTERSIASAIAPGFGLGGQVGYAGRRFTIKAAYVADALDSEEARAPATGNGVVARATVLAVDNSDTKLHLGIGAERRTLTAQDSVRFSITPGPSILPPVLRTPRFTGLSSRHAVNGEVAIMHRNLVVQAQYMMHWLDLDIAPDVEAKGGYFQAAWMATGQDYRYSRRSVAPAGPRLSDSKMPAVELAARYSWVTATQSGQVDQAARSLDLSASLYVIRIARFMVNATLGTTRSYPLPERTFKALTARLQFTF